jgi:transposase
VAATPAASVASIEIVGERRRAHDAAFRAHVLTEAMAPGIRISDLARRHGICASLIYRWRREMSPRVGAASAVQLVPVQVNASGVSRARASRPASEAPVSRSGVIEIELTGGVRIRVDGEVSLVALRRVVTALRG